MSEKPPTTPRSQAQRELEESILQRLDMYLQSRLFRARAHPDEEAGAERLRAIVDELHKEMRTFEDRGAGMSPSVARGIGEEIKAKEPVTMETLRAWYNLGRSDAVGSVGLMAWLRDNRVAYTSSLVLEGVLRVSFLVGAVSLACALAGLEGTPMLLRGLVLVAVPIEVLHFLVARQYAVRAAPTGRTYYFGGGIVRASNEGQAEP